VVAPNKSAQKVVDRVCPDSQLNYFNTQIFNINTKYLLLLDSHQIPGAGIGHNIFVLPAPQRSLSHLINSPDPAAAHDPIFDKSPEFFPPVFNPSISLALTLLGLKGPGLEVTSTRPRETRGSNPSASYPRPWRPTRLRPSRKPKQK
jgi:hypothetical protein